MNDDDLATGGWVEARPMLGQTDPCEPLHAAAARAAAEGRFEPPERAATIRPPETYETVLNDPDDVDQRRRAEALAAELFEACDDNRRLEIELSKLREALGAQEKAYRLRVDALIDENTNLRAVCHAVRVLGESADLVARNG